MFRITLAVLALALVAAPFVVDAQTVALLSNQMTSPLVGTTAPLGAGKGIATGMVTILDDHTMIIKNFTYNNTAPNTHIYAGKNATQAGFLGGFELNPVRIERAYFNEDVIVPIYSNITWSEVNAISVWCETFKVDFGHVMLQPMMMMGPAMAPMSGMVTPGGRKML